MSYSKSLFARKDFKRADILDAARDEKEIVMQLIKLLVQIKTISAVTGIALAYRYDSKMDTRQRELFERTKNEILAT